VVEAKEWHVGSMNDAIFIIDRSPHPNVTDYPLREGGDTQCILAFGAGTQETIKLAEEICTAHNATLASLRARLVQLQGQNYVLSNELDGAKDLLAECEQARDGAHDMAEQLHIEAHQLRSALAEARGKLLVESGHIAEYKAKLAECPVAESVAAIEKRTLERAAEEARQYYDPIGSAGEIISDNILALAKEGGEASPPGPGAQMEQPLPAPLSPHHPVVQGPRGPQSGVKG
jgi:hypothetical protein